MTNAITLQDILQRYLGHYSQSHKLDGNRLKVCDHLLACHTEALGGLNYQCDHCEQEIPQYHSCRDRHCPQCQHRATKQWRDKQQQSVLPVTYYHLVFTLPHLLNGWVQLHPEVIFALLFKAVWKTLKTFGADKKRLNGQLGMTAVLHTWGQTLSQHVHLHCLVPGGAIDDDGQWHAAKSNYLFPVKALSRHFRGNMVGALRCSEKQGKLSRANNTNEVDRMLDQLMQIDWMVYSKPCLNRTDSVIGYLAQYTHRIAISNQRIIDINNDEVRLRYKDYRDNRQKVMALQAGEFIRRFLLHVLPKGLMRIRHYGFLANRCRKASIETIRGILSAPVAKNIDQSVEEPVAYPCPKCRKGRLIFKYRIAPTVVWAHPQPG